MFSRTSKSLLLAAAALLSACGAEADPSPSPNALASASPSGPAITCATGGSTALGPGCLLERLAGGSEIILYHPDGGFRRLARDPATGALTSRDGAELLVSEQGGEGVVQFRIGADRYRIPLELLTAPA